MYFVTLQNLKILCKNKLCSRIYKTVFTNGTLKASFRGKTLQIFNTHYSRLLLQLSNRYCFNIDKYNSNYRSLEMNKFSTRKQMAVNSIHREFINGGLLKIINI